MVTPYERLRRGLRAAQQADARRPREAVRAVQLRRRGGRERRQDRPARDRPGRGRGVRPRLSRPHQPDHGDDRQEHAVQGGLRAVRGRGLPGADGLPVPLARRSGQVRGRGARRGDEPHPRPGRRRERRGRRDRADPGRGRLHRAAGRLPARRWPSSAGPTASSSSPTRSSPASAAPATGSRATTRAWCPTWSRPPRASRAGCRWPGVTGRAEIMDAVHPGGLGGTYGGNPVACAAALGAIDTMRKEDLPARARRDRERHAAAAAARWRERVPGHRRRARPRRDARHRAGQAGHAGARRRGGRRRSPGLPRQRRDHR